MATGKKDATKAAKLLRNPKTSKNVKSVAGSDLSQAAGKSSAKKPTSRIAKAAAKKKR